MDGMRPMSCLVLLVIATLYQDLHADPCSSYTLLSGQYKRSTGYTLQDSDIAFSDNFLSKGWYRFGSGAGNDMATEAPPIKQCGTIFPIWLQGSLPSDADGEVNKIACIVGFSEPCSRTINIRIKSCGEFKAYYLLPAPQTSTGYCIGNETLCPPGQSSNTGFTPCHELYGRKSNPTYTHYLPPINTNPAVNVSLENKQCDNPEREPVEPVFKCLFDEPDGGPYWYDTYWYINTDLVKLVESQLYMSNHSWLYPKDWVDMYDLNMVIFLFDEDKKIANKVCSARTDPRMSTFDGKSWTASLSGEFVMYRDSRRKIAVHALFSTCNMDFSFLGWFPPCICGIAVRVENSLYVYRTCGVISNHYAKPILQHHNVYHICDNRHMTVENGDPVTKITLPNGAVVTYGKIFHRVYMIHVTPSIFDEDNVKGLCGNPNDNMADDFTLQGLSSIVENAREFQASWRVDLNSTESLFGTNTVLDSTVSEVQKYCECATTEQQSEVYSIAGFYTTNCSLATETVNCSVGTTQSFANTCGKHKHRYKRKAKDMDFEHHIKTRSLDSDDTIEPQPLIIDSDFDPNFIPTTSSWKNGWTEPKALEHCKNMIVNSTALIECEKYIPMETHTTVAMEDCVLDIKDSGSAEFSKYTMESVKKYCFEQIKKYEVFHTKNDSDGISVVERIGKLVCPSDCSSNGICYEGTCTCSSSYVGIDCSHAKTTPPSNLSLPDGGLCKNTKRPCEETNIFGHFQSETVFVKFERFELKKSGTTTILSTTTLQPTYLSLTILKISIPNSRSKRSPSADSYGMGFYISLSYDAIHFSESLALVIYNDACYTCSATPPECSISSVCQESSTRVNTVTQSSTVVAKNDYFPGGSNPSDKHDVVQLPWNFISVVFCVIVLALVLVFIVYQKKLKSTTQLSSSFADLKMAQLEFGQPPVQYTESTNCDRN